MDRLVASLHRMQSALRTAGIESAVIGAMALAVWGEPRYTKDVDFKVMLDRDNAGRLLAALPGDCVPLGPPHDMLERSGLLFVKDGSGVRIDLLLADIGFDEEAIRRARDVEIAPGVLARVCTPEDLVIYKLISTREKDQVDAASVIRRQPVLDDVYIRGWLREFEEALADSTLVAAFDRLLHRRR